MIEIPLGTKGKMTLRLLHKDDVQKMQHTPSLSVPVVGGENNGGVLRSKIGELERRIEKLEAFVKQF